MNIDFHTHTHYSYDSLMKPEKIISIAKRKGLDGIVICDHNTIQGGLDVQKANHSGDFTVIVGAEIATDAGDITGIFLNKEIKSRVFLDVVKEIKEQGGKVILNHPFKGHDLSKIDFTKIDFVEGYNSRLNSGLNAKAQQLALQYNIPIVAGSDAHLYGEIGNCRSKVKSLNDLTPIDHVYKPSKPVYGLLSQYIKAWKRKSAGIFISATIVFFKRSILR